MDVMKKWNMLSEKEKDFFYNSWEMSAGEKWEQDFSALKIDELFDTLGGEDLLNKIITKKRKTLKKTQNGYSVTKVVAGKKRIFIPRIQYGTQGNRQWTEYFEKGTTIHSDLGSIKEKDTIFYYIKKPIKVSEHKRNGRKVRQHKRRKPKKKKRTHKPDFSPHAPYKTKRFGYNRGELTRGSF